MQAFRKQHKVIYLKHCPRCGGDVQASEDVYGQYIHCLQCGYSDDIASPNPFISLRSALRILKDDVA